MIRQNIRDYFGGDDALSNVLKLILAEQLAQMVQQGAQRKTGDDAGDRER